MMYGWGIPERGPLVAKNIQVPPRKKRESGSVTQAQHQGLEVCGRQHVLGTVCPCGQKPNYMGPPGQSCRVWEQWLIV